MNSYILITGASGGLGKAFSLECAERGWDLFLTDRDSNILEELATGIKRLYNIRVIHKECDLTDDLSRNRLWSFIEDNELKFNFLINVAGLDYEGIFNEQSVGELDTIIRLNINATVVMTNRILKYRDYARQFRIVNVSSLAAYYPMPVKATYAASKRFILDFSLAIGEELKRDDVSVTVLCPGGMPSNEEVIESIELQGFFGMLTTKNVGYVASRTIDHALGGKKIYIPGSFNVLLQMLGKLVPAGLIARFIAMRWEHARACS